MIQYAVSTGAQSVAAMPIIGQFHASRWTRIVFKHVHLVDYESPVSFREPAHVILGLAVPRDEIFNRRLTVLS